MKTEKQALKRFISYDNSGASLEDCQNDGCESLFMPDVIDNRLNGPSTYQAWGTFVTTQSIVATGKTKQGNPVVVYAHIPNYFSNPKSIGKALNSGLVNGAGKIPQGELLRLIGLAEAGTNGVYVVPYETLMASKDRVGLEDAPSHPQIIPFCNGKDRALRLMERIGQVYRTKDVKVKHSDDLHSDPVARLLCVSGSRSALLGDVALDGYSCLLGMPRVWHKK